MSYNSLAEPTLISKATLINAISTLKTILLCSIFMVVGPTLILLNKFIMQTLNFPYPIMLSGIGVVFSGLFSHFLVRFGFVHIDNSPSIVQGLNYYKRILPIAVSTAATLAFGNYVYLLLDVGFIQMLKSFTPVIVMLGLFLSGIETLNQPIIISICLISIGTAITCSFTPQINVLGIFIFLLSSGAEAVRMVLSQFLLKDLKLGVIESQYFLAMPTAICLFTASATSEIPLLLASITTSSNSNSNNNNTGSSNSETSRLYQYSLLFLLAGVLGIIVNFLTYFVIQITSSLTLKILGTLRNVILIVIGIVFYHEVITSSEGCGYFVALIGFVGYNAAQMKLWPQQRQEALGEQKRMVLRNENSSSDNDISSRLALLASSPSFLSLMNDVEGNNSNNINNNNSNSNNSNMIKARSIKQ